jgi:cobalt-zinc-cadmium efflux system protein
VNILLEAVLKGVDMHALERSAKALPGVLSVHDLHVWGITSELFAASLYVLVSEQRVSSSQQILEAVTEKLRHEFGIGHATIQIEADGCGADETRCAMWPLAQGHERHGH